MLGYSDSRWILCDQPCPLAYDRSTIPSTYHNRAMLDNQLEKGLTYELKGGMMGGVSIQWLLGKVTAARLQALYYYNIKLPKINAVASH